MKKLLLIATLLSTSIAQTQTQPQERHVNYDIAEGTLQSLLYGLSHFYIHTGVKMYSDALTTKQWSGLSADELLFITGLSFAINRFSQKRIKQLCKKLEEKGREDISTFIKEIYTGTNIISGIMLPHTLFSNYKKFDFS